MPAQSLWNNAKQGAFITALCQDERGDIFVGTEDNGVWEWNGASWRNFTSVNTAGALGDDDIYSLACDKLGRIWAGTDRHGISVYNGAFWEHYGRVIGPLGCHVVALAVSPKDGDIWGATEAGLFKYSLHGKTWSYYTRADGLPSDQADSLAFAKNGTLFVGTLCNGIAIASPSDDYTTWRTVAGPSTLPNTPSGVGLPTNQINCLFVAQDNEVYAGTTTGLARSANGGKTWSYVRGADWQAKEQGLYPPVTPTAKPAKLILSGDYVTALAEDPNGHLFIGHRQTGLERYSELDEKMATPKNFFGGYVDCLLTLSSGKVLIGTYGDGLLTAKAKSPAFTPSQANLASAKPVPFPVDATPPTQAQLAALLKQVQSLHATLKPGQAEYLGEDWDTQGDWVGRYGVIYANLCSAGSPIDQYYTWTDKIIVNPQLGPHHLPGDLTRHYMSSVTAPNRKSLYSLFDGHYTQSEWDDHGEAYPPTWQGPGLWISITVPKGVFRISFYDMNKDAHGWRGNAYRDYLFQIFDGAKSPSVLLGSQPLAQGRLRNFWQGAYERFLICGPAKYWLHISRNYSTNTILAGVFADHAVRRHTLIVQAICGMNLLQYRVPPVYYFSPSNDYRVLAAQTLWERTQERSLLYANPSWVEEAELLAYRTAEYYEASDSLLASMRWVLDDWTKSDRATFTQIMRKAYDDTPSQIDASNCKAISLVP